MQTEILEKLQYWKDRDDCWELCRQGAFYFVRYERTRTKVDTAGKGKEGIESIIHYFDSTYPTRKPYHNDMSFECEVDIWNKEQEFILLCKKYLK